MHGSAIDPAVERITLTLHMVQALELSMLPLFFITVSICLSRDGVLVIGEHFDPGACLLSPREFFRIFIPAQLPWTYGLLKLRMLILVPYQSMLLETFRERYHH